MEKKRIVKRVANIVFYTFLALLAVLIVFMFVSRISGKVTFIGNRTAMWVMTESMEDTIPAKSYILVRKANAQEIEVGDVIVFYSDNPQISGSLNTHRVIEVIGDHEAFLTKGDHNPVADDARYPARAENVVAVYERNLPVMSFFGRLFLSPFGLVLVFVLIIGVTWAVWLPDMIRGLKKKQQQAAEEKQAEIDRLVREEVAKLQKNAPDDAGRQDPPQA